MVIPSAPELPAGVQQLRFPPPGPFAQAVSRRVLEEFRATGAHRYADAALWLRAACCAGLAATAYLLLLYGAGGRGGAILEVALAAFCGFMVVVLLGHDASHGALSRHGWVNRAAVFASFAVLGVDGAQWADRHVRLHHGFTNLPGTGADADAVNIMRLAPYKPWHPVYRLQPLYGPVLFALGHASLAWIEDFFGLRALRREGRREFLGWRPVLAMLAAKAVHGGLFLALPWIVLRPSAGALLGGYALASAVVAIAVTLLLVSQHVSDLADFPLPGPDGRLPHDRATHRVLTAVDWAPRSRLAAALTGGANAHVAHHLFPGHSHRHLAAFSATIAEIAAAHGVRHRVSSLPGMALAQWRHLLALSRRPGVATLRGARPGQ